MTASVPAPMYEAVTDMLSDALRREIPLRAEIITLAREIVRLNVALAAYDDPQPAEIRRDGVLVDR